MIKTTIYFLDACALLAIFNDVPGVQKVLDLLNQARTGTISLFINMVQLLEVYYDRIYIVGENEARSIKDDELKAAEEAGEFSVLWLK